MSSRSRESDERGKGYLQDEDLRPSQDASPTPGTGGRIRPKASPERPNADELVIQSEKTKQARKRKAIINPMGKSSG